MQRCFLYVMIVMGFIVVLIVPRIVAPFGVVSDRFYSQHPS